MSSVYEVFLFFSRLYIELMRKRSDIKSGKHLILDFGDAWFLNQVMVESGLKELFRNVLSDESDTLLSLVAFKLLDSNANSYAQRWLIGSYAQYLYPKAKLESPRISEFMERLARVSQLAIERPHKALKYQVVCHNSVVPNRFP